MHSFLKALCVVCAFVGGGQAAADDGPLLIAGAYIPKVFEPGKDGPYEAFFEDVVKKAPVPLTLQVLPVKRLARSFFEKEVACMYMATSDHAFYQINGTPLDELVTSKPFSRIFMRAYSRPTVPAIRRWEELDGKTIAGDEGIHNSTIAQRELPFAKRILYTKTVDEAFEILGAGRVDLAIAYSIDAEQYFKRSGKWEFNADGNFSLLTLGENVTCWPSEGAERLVRYLNRQIDALDQSGVLTERYGFVVN